MKQPFLLFLVFAFSWPSWASHKQPNIVLMIADDMAWDDCGAYGNTRVRTPHLDQLANEGMRFNHALLTISSCSPSRSSIITGRYPHATNAEQLHWPLPGDQVTFVERLRAAGYWTGAAGKWHLGKAIRERFDDLREVDTSGFQLPTGDAGQQGKFVQLGPLAARSGCADWVPLLQDRPKNKPFFVWLAAVDPHRDYDKNILENPHQPEDAVIPDYLPDTPEVRADFALYYDEITRLDHYVGAVLEELDAQGVADNTVVLFISDNGRPFPRCKTTLYDSGIKTPWIVRWPGKTDAGSISDRLVSSVDIAATFLDLAGLSPGPTNQGISAKSLFLNPNAKPIRRYAFAERNWHDFEDHSRAVRTTRYKYIRHDYPDLPNTPPADAVRSPTWLVMQKRHRLKELTEPQQNCFVIPRPTEELFDIIDDPHELNNLAQSKPHQEILCELRAALRGWEDSTNDHVPAWRTPDEFDRLTGKPTPARKRPRDSKATMQAKGIVP